MTILEQQDQGYQSPATSSKVSLTRSLRPLYFAFCAGGLLMHGAAHLRGDIVWSAIEIVLAAYGILLAVRQQRNR
jgi:hypothetical protein